MPKPRINLTRFHGVIAPNSRHRIHVTPARRGKGRKAQIDKAWKDKTPTERHVAMTWMRRLKRAFKASAPKLPGLGSTDRVYSS
ncbi:MAG: hypothetical protein IIC59_02505 [Proteobacteria bacterium]|nr:hypothetical protein [Pseudomonadota bacterium]